MSCHVNAFGSTAAAEIHTNDGVSFPLNRITCIECHDPHDGQQNAEGDENLNMVLGTITVMTDLGNIDAVFADKDYSGDNSYDYSRPDGSGICQICHTKTIYQRNTGMASNHKLGLTCTTADCHPHSKGFDNVEKL